jgi:hypothetical protein
MLPLESKPSKEPKKGLYFSFHGDPEALKYLNLKLELTIVIDKPFVTTVPIIPLISDQDWKNNEIVIEPLVSVEVIGEKQREYLLKTKGPYLDNVLYIYFPSDVRVDETVNVPLPSPRKCISQATNLWFESCPKTSKTTSAKC